MLTQNYLILAECNLLRAHHPTGVFVMPSTEDPLVWCGIISVRSGYYTGGIFNVQLYLPEDFPSNTLPCLCLPKGFYHPLVNPDTGQVSLTFAFPQWDIERHHIWHVLHYLRFILTNLDGSIFRCADESVHPLLWSDSGDSSQRRHNTLSQYANPDAAELVQSKPAAFEKKARECIKTLSIWALSNTSDAAAPSASTTFICVDGWDDASFIARARQKLKATVERTEPTDSQVLGYSWLDPDTMAIFSKEQEMPKSTDA